MKKLNVIILTMILSLVIFAGVNVMAMDENTVKTEEPKTVISEEAPKGIEGGNTAEEVKAEEKEEIVEEGNKEASVPNEDKATETVDEKVNMGGVPSSNIDTDKAAEPEDKKPSDAKEETKSEEKAAEEKAKQDDSKKSEETKPEEKKSEEVNPNDKKDVNTEEKPDDAKKDAEAEVKAEEEKKPDETKDADAKTDEEKATETKTEEEKAKEGENAEVNADAKELKAGETLEISELAENPIALGSGQGSEAENVVKVTNFNGLKEAIEKAENTPTIIKVMKSFYIEDTITIKEGQDITLIADNQEKADDPWRKIAQPSDFADKGEEKQREIIEEARERGDEAIEKANDGKVIQEGEDFYYNFDGTEIIIKRSNTFTGTMFEVIGKLTLGNKNSSINFDGNKKEIISDQGDRGSFFDIQSGGELALNNGVIANGESKISYTGAVKVNNGGKFYMNGGRISSNLISANQSNPLTSGAVFVIPGGKFTMNNGMIDHNIGAAGAILAGDLFGAQGKDIISNPYDAAIVEVNGGNIISNQSMGERYGTYKLSGGIAIFTGGTLNFNDGIIANNIGSTRAGGIIVTDQYIVDSHENHLRKADTPSIPYDEYIRNNKAEANLKGGLIYKNFTPERGGGIYVDSNCVNFERIMILNNTATTFGGGIYVSYAPRTQKLENVLITENHAIKGTVVSTADNGTPGTGGGIWNCAYGSTHIGDGHSIYVYNNTSYLGKGSDYSYATRTIPFELNGKRIEDQFYIYLSPITKEHNFIKFLNDDGSNNSIPANMSYSKKEILLKAIYNEELQKEAWRNSGTFILGNEAGNGAGYGSNADNYSPKDEGEIEFTFKKNWDEKIDESEYENKDIHVDIFIVPLDKDEVYVRSQYGYDKNLYKYGEVLLNQGNNWQARFSNNSFSNFTLAKDKGLPFTKEALAKLGYKYLVMERETEYASTVEEKNAEAPIQPGTVLITRDKSIAQAGNDKGNHNADFYFYELNKDGMLSYLGKSTKNNVDNAINAEFSHEILSNNIVSVVSYGKDRKLIDKYDNWITLKGYGEALNKYSIFVEKTDDGIILHVPYIWTEHWDGGLSGIKVVKKDVVPEEKKDFYGYEFVIDNSPYTEAKIKKTWKMLTEEEIREALGEYRKDVEVKNREIPDQVTFYILNNGKKIVVDYIRDENGKVHPVYKTVTITKKNNWEGIITKLNSRLLEKGAYGIEEEQLEGFKMSYELNKVLVNPREDMEDDEDRVNIKFRLSREYVFLSSLGSFVMKQAGYIPQDVNQIINDEPFSGWLGNITVRLIVDGQIKEQKTMNWNGRSFEDDDLLFGYSEDNPIIVDAKGHNIKIKYYNSMNGEWGYHDAGYTNVNLFLKKDENGIYTLYVPNLLTNGNFAKVFKVTERDIEGFGRDAHYPEITDFNPKAANLEPYYEYTFLAKNEELPPEPPTPEPRKTFVRVNKVWEAIGETRDIQVELYINGKASGKYLTLNAANGWSASFTNLDIDDGMGNLYVYTVKEVGENDKIYNIDERKFEVSYSGDMYKGFTIVNKEVPTEEPEEPEEPEEEEPHEPEEENEKPKDKNRLPKTGVTEDSLAIFLGLVILLGLVYIKKKYIVEKSK